MTFIVVFILFFAGLGLLSHEWRLLGCFLSTVGFKRSRSLVPVVVLLQEIQETLESGWVMTEKQTAQLGRLPPPWNELSSEVISELRSRGARLVPTLIRLKEMARVTEEDLARARARASQSLFQAAVGTAVVPLLSFMLWSLLPSLSERGNHWWWLTLSTASFLFCLCGALWMTSMTVRAAWGGFEFKNRGWTLYFQCFGEKLLALISAGDPPDMAWQKAYPVLRAEAPELSRAIGRTVWDPDDLSQSKWLDPAAQPLISAGRSIRKSIQMSLLHGRGSIDRVQLTLEKLQSDLRAQTEREVQLLGARTLKPLFIFIAPSVLILLFAAVWQAGKKGLGVL